MTVDTRAPHRRVQDTVGRALVVYPAGVTVIAAATWLVSPQNGPLAMAQIVLPHLFLIGFVVCAVAVILSRRAGAVAVVVLLCTMPRFAGDWVSLPTDAKATSSIRVATWNLEQGSRGPRDAIEPLLAQGADVIALQEVTPAVAAALDADPRIRAAFPGRALVPATDFLGLGVLSRFPIVAQRHIDAASALEARLRIAPDREIAVVTAHPLPGSISLLTPFLPISFDGTGRDARLARVREMIDQLVAHGTPVVVMGDFNVTPTEPGYRILTEGLTDVHAEIGNGPGWTWRPSRLEALGTGLIRIDYVLTSRAIRPIRLEVNCRNVGDHCLVGAELGIP
jgi:endonuclease/exonuclease/phosphatase family metal-dependent hydrolase